MKFKINRKKYGGFKIQTNLKAGLTCANICDKCGPSYKDICEEFCDHYGPNQCASKGSCCGTDRLGF